MMAGAVMTTMAVVDPHASGGRYPAYRGWGWAQGVYPSPVIVVSPLGYRGWARNYPFSTPVIVLPSYDGWAASPAYPIKRRP